MEVTGAMRRQSLSVQLLNGENGRAIAIHQAPFQIGRAAGCDLPLPQPYVSRQHAQISLEGSRVVVHDNTSRHGTYVNGQPVSHQLLQLGDVIQFGSLAGPEFRLISGDAGECSTHTILEQLQVVGTQQSDIEKLRWFLQAAHELSSAGSLERVLASLLQTTLALARVERGYVFLRNAEGSMELALGRDSSGELLTDTSSLSRTVLRQAAEGTDQFIVTDTWTAEGTVAESIVAHNIRTILCIPLRQLREVRRGGDVEGWTTQQVFGLLYLDSRFQPERVSDVDHDLLRTIAREAAALVENAQLAQIEDQARQHKEELEIASRIQQSLMAVHFPVFAFAEVQAHSVACSAVGGDFFDVVCGEHSLNVALVDVSGKGISAAILASTLQGMLNVQLEAGHSLQAIASATNRYLCTKNVGKYATMLLLRLHEDGMLEYMNCGHIQPRVCTGERVKRLEQANLPVGLLPLAEYTCGVAHLLPGHRVVLVSDGFTEAEGPGGDFFGEERFDAAVVCTDIQSALHEVATFCNGQPPTDDLTIVQLLFNGLPHAPDATPGNP